MPGVFASRNSKLFVPVRFGQSWQLQASDTAENWNNATFIAMDDLLGGLKRGWPGIRVVYQRIFESPPRVTIEFHNYTRELGDLLSAVSDLADRLRSAHLLRSRLK